MKIMYEALDADGKEVKGEVEAEHVTAAIEKIRALGLFPTKVVEVTAVDKEKEPTQDGPVSKNKKKLMAAIAAMEAKVEDEKASEMEKLGLEALQLILKYEEPLNESMKVYGKALVEWLVERQKNKPINKIKSDLEEIKISLRDQGKVFTTLLKALCTK